MIELATEARMLLRQFVEKELLAKPFTLLRQAAVHARIIKIWAGRGKGSKS